MAYKMTRNHNKYLQIFEEFDREKKKNFFWHKTDDDGKQEFEREWQTLKGLCEIVWWEHYLYF